jgi:hypothetical protein
VGRPKGGDGEAQRQEQEREQEQDQEREILMRPDDVMGLVRKRPFVPLRIHMTDGRAYDIQHPEMIIISRSQAMVGLQPNSKTGVIDRIERCGLNHIVRIEEMKVASSESSSSALA